MGDPAAPKIFRFILMERQSNKILSVESLKIGYSSGSNEKVLLPPLNTHAKKGELIAVIGRNGIGKSTLLRTLTGLQKPLGGDILYDGKNIKDYSLMELAQKVGYISTETVKVSNMRVYDLVALGRFPYTNWIGKIEAKDHEAIRDALTKTSMDSFSNRYVSELSDGERQKAMIARILAQDTGVMIMDEPTAFLDVGSKYEIFHLMNILSNSSDKTIIFSTHDLQMAISHSDIVWLILDDRLITGAPEDLMMAGAFEHLFDPTTVVFNSYDGTFSFRSETKGNIYIEGGGITRHWTEQAVQRAGFTISKQITSPKILIPDEKNPNWQLKSDTDIKEFNTVYELIECLKKQVVNLF
jgi:iron complex transport system ATP-binding protein